MKKSFRREPNGDYLHVLGITETDGTEQVLACAITGQPASICITSASKDFLKTCPEVTRAAVPVDWMRHFVARLSRDTNTKDAS